MIGSHPPREARALAALGVFPLLPFVAFHLFQQWALLSGRAAWLARMHATMGGSVGVAVAGLVGVAPLAVWAVLLARAALRGGPLPGWALEEDNGALERALAAIAKPAALLTAVSLLAHAAALWGPRALGHASLPDTHEVLAVTTGRPWVLAAHALGLTAFAAHTACAIPAAFRVLRGDDPDTRGSVALVALGAGLAALVLFGQLVGWVGAGIGTFWPIEVVAEGGDVAADAPAE